MKKIIFILLISLNLFVNAQEFNSEGIYYEIIDPEAKTCRTKNGSAFNPGNLCEGYVDLTKVPIFNGEEYILTEIGAFGFAWVSYSQPYITEIQFPNTLSTIGMYAFSQQAMITSIEIPGSVETIMQGAFANTTSLRYFKLNDGIKHIGRQIFQLNWELTELILPQTLETIDYGFYISGGIKNLICESYEPPIVINADATVKSGLTGGLLYVPRGSKELYLQAPGWSSYGADRIEELDKLLVFFDKKSLSMVKGTTQTLNIVYSYDQTNPDTAPIRIKWESEDETVAKVEEDRNSSGQLCGIVKAVGSGNTRISLTLYPGGATEEPATAYCEVTVKDGNVSFNLSDDLIELELKETKQLIIDLTGLEEGKSTLSVIVSNEIGESVMKTCDIIVLGLSTEVSEIFIEEEDNLVDIYTLNGILVKHNVKPEAIKELPKGIYVVGDKKLLVK